MAAVAAACKRAGSGRSSTSTGARRPAARDHRGRARARPRHHRRGAHRRRRVRRRVARTIRTYEARASGNAPMPGPRRGVPWAESAGPPCPEAPRSLGRSSWTTTSPPIGSRPSPPRRRSSCSTNSTGSPAMSSAGDEAGRARLHLRRPARPALGGVCRDPARGADPAARAVVRLQPGRRAGDRGRHRIAAPPSSTSPSSRTTCSSRPAGSPRSRSR